MIPNVSGYGRIAASDLMHESLPETVQLTTATMSEWRSAGYRLSERRVAPWLYLIVRGGQDAAVYKLVGPVFRHHGASYDGFRVA